ncbi:hypothetical protein CURTO8I2_130082 [Curtobacterium sp. 8I-2]|nr:hypothetical protein CURTO8I2_130082 [Curtobacterium sp. 8I-2]
MYASIVMLVCTDQQPVRLSNSQFKRSPPVARQSETSHNLPRNRSADDSLSTNSVRSTSV